jgi:hypothetical protein
MPRVDGKTLVLIATTATVCAVGFGTVYLPFYADKDKIRGLNENADTEAKKEMEKLLKESGGQGESSQQAGSMWKNMGKK